MHDVCTFAIFHFQRIIQKRLLSFQAVCWYVISDIVVELWNVCYTCIIIAHWWWCYGLFLIWSIIIYVMIIHCLFTNYLTLKCCFFIHLFTCFHGIMLKCPVKISCCRFCSMMFRDCLLTAYDMSTLFLHKEHVLHFCSVRDSACGEISM